MKFSLVQNTTEEITHKSNMIVSISNEIGFFLKGKNYGVDLNNLFIGIVCVSPQFEQFFKPRKKYTKTKKTLEYSLTLDFESFKNTSESDARKILVQGILDSIVKVTEDFKLESFNVSLYKKDLNKFFSEKGWI